MKSWFLLAAWCCCGIAFGQSSTDKISTVLMQRLADMPNEEQQVIVVMKEKADLGPMENEFRTNRTSKKERIAKLLPLLQNTARQSQAGIINYLTASRAVALEDIRSLWIANVLGLAAKEDLIYALAERDDVADIIWNSPTYLEEYECEESSPEEMVTQPNGTEPGLRAINAGELWALGYTGYGTIAFGADTGIEAFHPAYVNRWMGLYTDATETWYEYDNNNTIPNNCGDHGTHTLGTMIGVERLTNDTIGVAPNANWIGGPILCTNVGTLDNVGAFEWALNPDGDVETVIDMPTVINNSWWDPSQEGIECNSVYVQSLQVTEMAGISVIFSAGNAGPGVGTITSPKNINLTEINSFAVGNLNGNNNNFPITQSSSRGPSVCGGDSSLLIKPEVSAPGTSVRSCELDRTYGNKTGTSMAAPHVAGAILLLQEAFPELVSEDFKWALYLSAIDLGAPGEDNNYGMGIIDVKAAYDYLIDQGHTPTPPRSTNLDLIGADVDPQLEYCGVDPLTTFFIINGGDDIITSFDYEIVVERYSGVVQYSDTGSWTGSIEKGEVATVTISLEDIPAGNYVAKFNSSLPNGTEDPRPLNNALGKLITITNPGSLELGVNGSNDVVACEGSMTTLTGSINTTSDYFFKWYDDYQITDFLGQGKTYTFEMGSEIEEFYAIPFLQDIGGADIPNSGGEFTKEKTLAFTAMGNVVLSSVEVYTEELGARFINIKRADGTTVTTRSMSLENVGRNVVDIDVDLSPGSYIMGFFGPNPLLERSADVTYPYMVGTGIRIDGASEEGIYPYFYNWKMERPFNCGAQRVVVEPLGELNMELAFDVPSDVYQVGDQIAVTNNSTGAIQYDWLVNGILNIEDMENPTFSFDTPGLYELTMVATNAAGCQSTSSVWVDVDAISSLDFPSEQYEFQLFPNPTNGQVNVAIEMPDNTTTSYFLLDNLGRQVPIAVQETSGSSSFQLDVSSLPAGLYFFEVRISGKPNWVHKLLVN